MSNLRQFFFSFILIFLGISFAYADVTENVIITKPSLYTEVMSFGYKLGADFYQYVTSPFRWDSNQWLTFAAISGVTYLIVLNDRNLLSWASKDTPDSVKNLFNFFYPAGSWTNAAAGVGGLYLISTLTQDKKLQQTSYLALKSFIFSSATTQGLKTAFHRQFTSDLDPYKWDGPVFDLDTSKRAFPGGHASTIWSVATVFADQYSNDPLIPYLVYFAAVCGTLADVTRLEHWPSDVFFGACIGFFTAKSVIYLDSNPEPFLIPLISPQALGLQVNYKL